MEDSTMFCLEPYSTQTDQLAGSCSSAQPDPTGLINNVSQGLSLANTPDEAKPEFLNFPVAAGFLCCVSKSIVMHKQKLSTEAFSSFWNYSLFQQELISRTTKSEQPESILPSQGMAPQRNSIVCLGLPKLVKKVYTYSKVTQNSLPVSLFSHEQHFSNCEISLHLQCSPQYLNTVSEKRNATNGF